MGNSEDLAFLLEVQYGAVKPEEALTVKLNVENIRAIGNSFDRCVLPVLMMLVVPFLSPHTSLSLSLSLSLSFVSIRYSQLQSLDLGTNEISDLSGLKHLHALQVLFSLPLILSLVLFLLHFH